MHQHKVLFDCGSQIMNHPGDLIGFVSAAHQLICLTTVDASALLEKLVASLLEGIVTLLPIRCFLFESVNARKCLLKPLYECPTLFDE